MQNTVPNLILHTPHKQRHTLLGHQGLGLWPRAMSVGSSMNQISYLVMRSSTSAKVNVQKLLALPEWPKQKASENYPKSNSSQADKHDELPHTIYSQQRQLEIFKTDYKASQYLLTVQLFPALAFFYMRFAADPDSPKTINFCPPPPDPARKHSWEVPSAANSVQDA